MPRLRATRSILKPPLGWKSYQHPIYNGLVAAYLYNEGGGLALGDDIGILGPCALSGTFNWAQGPHGPVVNYNGGIATGVTKGLNPLSWAFWLKVTTTAPSFQDPFCKSNSAVNQGWLFSVRSSGAVIQLDVGFSIGNFTLNIPVPDTTQWHFYVFTWDGTGLTATRDNAAVYLDGKFANPVTSAGNGTNQKDDTGQAFTMGSFTGGVSTLSNGLVDSLMMWNRTLRAEEVWELFISTYPAIFPRYPGGGRSLSQSLTASMGSWAGALIASKVKQSAIAVSMQQFSATLFAQVNKSLSATMASFAGALSTIKIKSGNSSTFSVSMANFAGALGKQTSRTFSASMARFSGTLAVAVQHGIPPPTCVPVAVCATAQITSHVEVCENPGS